MTAVSASLRAPHLASVCECRPAKKNQAQGLAVSDDRNEMQRHANTPELNYSLIKLFLNYTRINSRNAPLPPTPLNHALLISPRPIQYYGTSLHCAVAPGHVEAVRLLLDKGAHMGAKDEVRSEVRSEKSGGSVM